jgi:hypothetical protein
MHLKNGRSSGNGAYAQKGITSRVMVANRPKVSFRPKCGASLGTANSTVKEAALITEHVKGAAMMKPTIIAKKHEGAVNEMEKLLVMCMEAHIQKRVSVSLMEVQAKTRTN